MTTRPSPTITASIVSLTILVHALGACAAVARLPNEEASMVTYPSRTITVSIARDWREVYDFASVPQNFPRWAAGLGTRFERSGAYWTAEDPSGRPIRIRFSEPNEFGVLDHTVAAEDGRESRNAMRVVPNGTGAEVMFTLLRTPDMTDEIFSADAAAVERDLYTLKALFER